MRLSSIAAACAFSASGLASANSSPNLAPPSFPVSDGSAKAVFVDFADATYDIRYDIPRKATHVHTTIHFAAAEAGFPAFDFSGNVGSATLDGVAVAVGQESPASDGPEIQVVQSPVAVGSHTLVIDSDMTGEFAPTYTRTGVQSAFLTDDDAGRYLESYAPANFEFDQFKIVFNVEIVGLGAAQSFFTNGTLTAVDASHWRVEFPAYFNESAGYFHTIPTASVEVLNYTVDNGAGVMIPAVAYKKTSDFSDLEAIKATSIKAIADLSSRFGPFAHPSLTIYAQATGGGMEYHGATVSSDWALAHELGHSYFGRAVMPANGNAGWIDEAMATLTEGPYEADPSDISPTNMSGHSAYYTRNDDNGYGQGMNLLAHFGEEFHAANPAQSIDGFLREWYMGHRYTTVSVGVLKDHLESYSGKDLTAEFATYVFGDSAPAFAPRAPRSPVHRALTPAEFRSLQ